MSFGASNALVPTRLRIWGSGVRISPGAPFPYLDSITECLVGPLVPISVPIRPIPFGRRARCTAESRMRATLNYESGWFRYELEAPVERVVEQESNAAVIVKAAFPLRVGEHSGAVGLGAQSN